MPLRYYVAQDDSDFLDDFERAAIIVLAHNQREARKIAWQHKQDGWDSLRYVDLDVSRAYMHTPWAPAGSRQAAEPPARAVPGMVEDPATMRLFGFRFDDEDYCSVCGFAAYGMPEHAVDDECYMCPACCTYDECRQPGRHMEGR